MGDGALLHKRHMVFVCSEPRIEILVKNLKNKFHNFQSSNQHNSKSRSFLARAVLSDTKQRSGLRLVMLSLSFETLQNYCKQGTEMRQLVCMSADVYCQITNNFYLCNIIILYSNGKKGKRASCQRDRERERECV